MAFLMRSDLRNSSQTLRRNLKHIRSWLEEEGAAASKCVPCPTAVYALQESVSCLLLHLVCVSQV